MIEVTCKSCLKSYSKRGETLHNWLGYCAKCCGVPQRIEKVKKEDARRFRGEKHHNWIKDRSLLKKDNLRNDVAYQNWRKEVWIRDNFKCKIAEESCEGRIEAHHILSWRDYPELRYKINNGITLCHAHHPRKRVEEKRLSPYFMELVPVSKEII